MPIAIYGDTITYSTSIAAEPAHFTHSIPRNWKRYSTEFPKHPHSHSSQIILHFQTEKESEERIVISYTTAFALGGVPEQNVPHVPELELTRHIEHVRRQVMLERAEEQRTEIQLLQVVVAIRLVLLLRLQSQPRLRNDAVSVGRARRLRRWITSVHWAVHGDRRRGLCGFLKRWRVCQLVELEVWGNEDEEEEEVWVAG